MKKFCTFLLFAVFAPSNLRSADPTIDFNRDIRPILSNNCFACHGPDEKERKGKLRLDTREGAVGKEGEGAVVPGKPNESELLKRVVSEDASILMPPPKTGKKLTPREVELLTRWIKQGGQYATHWSYVKPVRPALPKPAGIEGGRNAIDAFIRDRLVQEKLKPSPEADKPTLIRRVALDLTGLPPTPQEVEVFLADTTPTAYEKMVDRFLAKPAFGEHWARMWLDLARYADSAGYADDPPRTIWAYRDYVIKSFNANKPFNAFTVEQLAGDLLPNPTQEQIIATAFHRNTLTNNEGGTSDEEFRNVAVVDRVNTTFAVWMGTSMACAQCHTHKYEPMTQKEYFRFFAFLNSTADNDRPDESPVLRLFSEEQKKQLAAWEAEGDRLSALLKNPSPELLAKLPTWEKQVQKPVNWQSPKPRFLSWADLPATIDESGAILVAKATKNDTYTVELPLAGETLAALRLEALPHASLPGQGPGFATGNFVISKISANLVPPTGSGNKGSKPVPFKFATADYSQKDFDAALVLNNPQPKQKGWGIGGSVGKPHTLTLRPAEPVAVLAGSKLVVTIEQGSSFADHLLGHFRLSYTTDATAIDQATLAPDVRKVLAIPVEKRTAEQKATVIEAFVKVAPETRGLSEQLASVQKQMADMKPATTVPVLKELATKRITKLQYRGNFLDVGEVQTEGVPAALHAFPKDAPVNRLGMAQWIVSPDNPLTARVTVNRFWEHIFGTGLVRTSEEFGSQGELPSHPELLDWLAVEFADAGQWDVKRFLKLLVTSATYRQSSRTTPELQERDPDNRLLARGPRYRLSAEMIRDQALAVSGLLSEKMYGPSVRPVRPSSGLNAAFGGKLDWATSMGEDRHRRGLYTEWRRTSPYPSMLTFDAPSREACTIRRGRTNTPLQALVTLNDPVYVEAAQALGRKMAAGGKSEAEKLAMGFKSCFARTPTALETEKLLKLYQDAKSMFAKDSKRTIEMATNPIGPVPQGADPTDLAAWAVVGNVLLNLDEFLMRR